MKFNIVTASDIKLINFVKPCLESIKSQGYDPLFYNLGGLDFGIPFEAKTSEKPLQKFPKKPFIIKDALSRIPKNSWLAWLDIDCIMKSSIDDALNDQYDVGVTFRKDHLNSGVTFWNNNKRTVSFLEKWCEASLKENGDQKGLNMLCKINSKDSINTKVIIDNTIIKVFDSEIYNNFFFKKNQNNAKILHYKSKFRDMFPYK